MMTPHLSGWQRVWLVSSALLLVFVAGLTVKDWPTRSEVYADTARSLLAVFRDAGAAADVEQLRRELGSLTDREIVERIDGYHRQERNLIQRLRYKRSLGDAVHDRLSRILETYDARMVRLPDERRALLLRRLPLWLASIAAIYLFGMAVGWVKHGFSR